MKVQHMENLVNALGDLIRHRATIDETTMRQVEEAYLAARNALIVLEQRDHHHVAGTTIGRPIDECAVCGHDIRHPIHIRKV